MLILLELGFRDVYRSLLCVLLLDCSVEVHFVGLYIYIYFFVRIKVWTCILVRLEVVNVINWCVL